MDEQHLAPVDALEASDGLEDDQGLGDATDPPNPD
jgi:hypothetical protein